jgi:hypothetical protein
LKHVVPPLFWPDTTRRVREGVPGFCFIAEVYWDREWTMLQQGFDYTYDKRLYDRLRDGHRPVREHLLAGLDFQDKVARFMENTTSPARPPPSRRRCITLRLSSPPYRQVRVLSSRSIRGAHEAHFAAPRACANRTHR